MKNNLVNLLKENTIYTPGQLKKFVRNKQNVADNFWINFLGIAGLYNTDPNNAKLMAYLKGQRVQLANIDDNSQDWSLVVHMAVEGNFISTAQANELTKFMALMKQGKIDKIDENLLRASLAPILPKLPPYSTIKSPISNWLKGKLTLSDLMKPFFRFAKHEDFCPEFAEFAKIIIPKIDDNLGGGKSGKVSATGKGMKGLVGTSASGSTAKSAKVPNPTITKKSAKAAPAPPVVKTPLDIMIDNLGPIGNSVDLWLLWMKIWPMKKSQRKKELNNHAYTGGMGQLADALDSYFASNINTIIYGHFTWGTQPIFTDIAATNANLYFSKPENLTKEHIENHYVGWLDKKQNRVGRGMLGKYLADNFDPMDKQHIEWMMEPGWTSWARKPKDTIAQFDTGNQGVNTPGYKVPGGEIQRKIYGLWLANSATFIKFLENFFSVTTDLGKSVAYSLRYDGSSSTTAWQCRYLIKYISMTGGSPTDDKKLVDVQDWFLKKFGKDHSNCKFMYQNLFCHYDACQAELVKKGILGTNGYTQNVKATAFRGVKGEDGLPIMNNAIWKEWIAIARNALQKQVPNWNGWKIENLKINNFYLHEKDFDAIPGFSDMAAVGGIGQFFGGPAAAKAPEFIRLFGEEMGSDIRDYPTVYINDVLKVLGYDYTRDIKFTEQIHEELHGKDKSYDMPSWKFRIGNADTNQIDTMFNTMKTIPALNTMFTNHIHEYLNMYMAKDDPAIIECFITKFASLDKIFERMLEAWETGNPSTLANRAEDCLFKREYWVKMLKTQIAANQKRLWEILKRKYLRGEEYRNFYALGEALNRHVQNRMLWFTDVTIVNDILRMVKESIATYRETKTQPGGSTWGNLANSTVLPRSLDEWLGLVAGKQLIHPETLVRGIIDLCHNPDNYDNKLQYVAEIRSGAGRVDKDSDAMWCNDIVARGIVTLEQELDKLTIELKKETKESLEKDSVRAKYSYLTNNSGKYGSLVHLLGDGQEEQRKSIKTKLVRLMNGYYEKMGLTNRNFLDIDRNPEDFDVEIKTEYLKKEAADNAHRYSKSYGMRGAQKELKDKLTGGIGIMMFDIFHSPHKKELNTIINSYGDRSDYVAKLLRDNIMMQPLIEEIMGSDTPIKPEVPMKPTDIVKVLKFNNFSYKTTGKGRSKKKDEGHVEYLERIKKLPTQEDTVHDLKVKRITATKEDCEKRTAEFFKYYTPDFKHGDVAVEVLDSFTVHFPTSAWEEFKKLHPTTEMVPCFHGTGTVAASMILRFGFKVSSQATMRSAGVAVAGRALGDGTYVAPWIDKACGYVRDGSNWSNRKGNIGYILEIDCILGVERQDYRSAGFSGATAFTSFKSAEYCVYDASKQIKVMRAHRVRLTNRKYVEAMHQKHFPNGITEENTMFPNFFEHHSKKYPGFKEYMKEVVDPEEPIDTAPIHAMRFIYFSDVIATSNTTYLTPEEFAETYANNNILIQDCQEGWKVVMYHKEIPEMTVVIPETEEFIQDNPEGLGALYLYWLDRLKTKKETT